MATTMKAAVLHGREDIRIERVPIPEAAPGELIVRGSDMWHRPEGFQARLSRANDRAPGSLWSRISRYGA